MHRYLADPPRWLFAIWYGVVGGVAVGLWGKVVTEASWARSGIVAIIGTIVATGTVWWLEPGWRRQRDELEGGLSADKAALARRTAVRGPVPDDPEVRAAALRIASKSLIRSRWQPGPRLTTALGGMMAIGSVGAALSGSLLAVLYALTGAGMLYSGLYLPKQLHRRIELLSQQ
ncbi:hypothetical protein [Kribbella sp. NPDC050459]|uniref:hypothetical protein n=1 Tax=Kribbella sp. NPDC050459 TaxID=3155785 RepID=UPI00340165A0